MLTTTDWLLPSWSRFFGLTTFRTCSIIFPTTVFVLFPNINCSLFWMKTLQNFGCFPFECRWGTFICSDKIERPMTSGFLDKLLWRTTIIQSCSTRTRERVISVAPIELRLFHNFLCHVSQSFSPCSPFVVPYLPIWLWQSAQIKYVVADLIWHVRHGTFLYSSTRHRSILVNNFPFVKLYIRY